MPPVPFPVLPAVPITASALGHLLAELADALHDDGVGRAPDLEERVAAVQRVLAAAPSLSAVDGAHAPAVPLLDGPPMDQIHAVKAAGTFDAMATLYVANGCPFTLWGAMRNHLKDATALSEPVLAAFTHDGRLASRIAFLLGETAIQGESAQWLFQRLLATGYPWTASAFDQVFVAVRTAVQGGRLGPDGMFGAWLAEHLAAAVATDDHTAARLGELVTPANATAPALLAELTRWTSGADTLATTLMRHPNTPVAAWRTIARWGDAVRWFAEGPVAASASEAERDAIILAGYATSAGPWFSDKALDVTLRVLSPQGWVAAVGHLARGRPETAVRRIERPPRPILARLTPTDLAPLLGSKVAAVREAALHLSGRLRAAMPGDPSAPAPAKAQRTRRTR